MTMMNCRKRMSIEDMYGCPSFAFLVGFGIVGLLWLEKELEEKTVSWATWFLFSGLIVEWAIHFRSLHYYLIQ